MPSAGRGRNRRIIHRATPSGHPEPAGHGERRRRRPAAGACTPIRACRQAPTWRTIGGPAPGMRPGRAPRVLLEVPAASSSCRRCDAPPPDRRTPEFHDMPIPKPIGVTELILRDGHQSLLATRMATGGHDPGLRGPRQRRLLVASSAGAGPPSTPASASSTRTPGSGCAPFARLMPKTRLQMLLRGQNLLGYRHYEDGVVDRFVEQGGRERHGRLPRLRCAQRPAQPRARAGGGEAHGQARPGHDLLHDQPGAHASTSSSSWRSSSGSWAADSICIKDMAALLKPQPAYDLVRGIKERCGEDMRVHVHVHATTGVTLVSLMKAIEAGADMRGHRDQLAEPRARATTPPRPSWRCSRAPATPPRWTRNALLRDQGALRQGPPALRRVPVEHHRRGDRDLREPDPRRHDLQHGEPAEAAGRRATASRRCWRRCRSVRKRCRLPAAGHPLQPDRRHPGGLQRADGPVQGPDRRVRRPDARLLRGDRRADATPR